MKWSIRLGRMPGIDVFIHVTFFALLAFIVIVHWMAHGSLAAAPGGLAFFLDR